MDWHLVPWAAIAAISIAAIGWLGRLHYVSNRSSERLTEIEKSVGRHGEEIALTNSRITITEKQIIELGARALTREDLKEVKTELVDRMDQLGNRMEKTVDRIVDVVTAKGPSQGAN